MILNDFVKNKLETTDVIFHKHFRKRQTEKNLSHLKTNVLIPAILNGQVIEYNWSLNNGGKYLIYCVCDNIILHVSLEYNESEDIVLLKTIYKPNEDVPTHIFKSDLKTRIKSNLYRPN